MSERLEALALLLGITQVRSQVAAGAKYGEFSFRKKSHGFSPEKRWSKFDNANHARRGFLEARALGNIPSWPIHVK